MYCAIDPGTSTECTETTECEEPGRYTWFAQTNGTLVFMIAYGIDFVTELNDFRPVSVVCILMYPFILYEVFKDRALSLNMFGLQ